MLDSNIDTLLVKQSVVDEETQPTVPFAGATSVLGGSAAWSAQGMPD